MREEYLQKREKQEEDGNGGATTNGFLYYSSLFASHDRDFLLAPTRSQIKISELEGKIIGIYFSANWYPPCQTFTKLLIQVYEQIKAIPESNFEIIYVSSDEDLNAFNDYYHAWPMPWLAIPFSDVETKKALNEKFKVDGIPRLVVLQPKNPNGNSSYNKDEDLSYGVEMIYRYGVEAYPFTKERIDQLLKEEMEKHQNQTLLNLLTNHERDFLFAHPMPKEVPVSSLMGKTIGLYFSAQWCLPGAKFTPKLISIYKKIKEMLSKGAGNATGDFEIVYIPSDHNEMEYASYVTTMPWLALPFGDPTVKNLTKHFDIRGIPSLVILGPNGKTVTKNGRNLINLYEENAFPFTEARIELLEKQADEEAKSLPKIELHSGHRHELNLVSQGNGGGPFICCDCDEQGSGWAYLCIDCGYEVHPKCVKAVERGPDPIK